MITLNVNGRTRKVDVPPGTPLLRVLREHLQLTGTGLRLLQLPMLPQRVKRALEHAGDGANNG